MSTARHGASIVDKAFSALEAVLVCVLGAMVVMVFANVVLRYGFGSGITVSEEISRFLFVWLIFLGSVPVMRQHGHLGVEMLVGKLSTPASDWYGLSTTALFSGAASCSAGAPGSRRSSTWRTLRPYQAYPWAGRTSPASSAQSGSAS